MARILITGSNSGFGKLAALSFARQGHGVVATMRTLEKGDDLRATAESEGLPIEIRRLDVTDAASVADGIGDPAELDAVVNNAGFEVLGALELVDDELWTRQLDTNVLGPMPRDPPRAAHVARATQRHDRERLEHRRCRRVTVRWRLRGVEARARGPERGAPLRDDRVRHPGASRRTGIVRHRLSLPTSSPSTGGRTPTTSTERNGSASRGGALSGDGPPADPQDVADAIVRAALDPDAPFRNFVGDDAQLIHTVKSSMSFEEFEAVMRDTLDWHE